MTDSTALQWHPIHPHGLAAATLGVTIFFTIIVVHVLMLRAWARFRNHETALEDYLMYFGGLLNMAHNAVVMYACFTGLGTPDDELNIAIMIEGAKMVTMWQILYVTGSAFIKVSICATLIRISTQRRYIYSLYTIAGVITLMSIMALIVVFIHCTPVSASWTGEGSCISVGVIVIPTYIFSAVNVITDLAVAILPACIVWNLQIRRKLKIYCCGILGIGVVASLATLVRMPYITAYTAPTNQLHEIGNIVLWTVVELDLGIVAGCLPMLRKLFSSLARDQSLLTPLSNKDDLITIGRLQERSARRGQLEECELETIDQVGDDSNRQVDKDDSSTDRIIQVTRDITTKVTRYERMK